jgi:polyferredoxin
LTISKDWLLFFCRIHHRATENKTVDKKERKKMKKQNWFRRNSRKFAFAVIAFGALAYTALDASALTSSTDPTSIYSTASTDFDAAVGIAIGAIGIGAAVYFVRKGLKARM